jgi:hypothetical protein
VTAFGDILRRAVLATPGAIGGAFADAQGEMVDSFAIADPYEWAVLVAHYGVILRLLDAWLGTRHFGGPEYFIAQHHGLDIVVHSVHGGYYALIAVRKPSPPLGLALVSLREATHELKLEMMA